MGGGFRANPKVSGHFLCTNNFGILVRKGGREPDQIQKFAGLRAGERQDTDGAPESLHGSQMIRDFLELGLP